MSYCSATSVSIVSFFSGLLFNLTQPNNTSPKLSKRAFDFMGAVEVRGGGGAGRFFGEKNPGPNLFCPKEISRTG